MAKIYIVVAIAMLAMLLTPAYSEQDEQENKLEKRAFPPCKEGEHYNDCGTACPRTCDTSGQQDIGCIQVCKEGCFCNKGLVRNRFWVCVPPSQCPRDG